MRPYFHDYEHYQDFGDWNDRQFQIQDLVIDRIYHSMEFDQERENQFPIMSAQ
jgi:hypothetical protein